MGGFGEVYLATMSDADGEPRDVAVKILHPGIDPTAQAIQRLQDEARLLGLLQHPSIIRVVDLLQYKSRLALVTEFVDGEDLSTCFLALPPPSPRAMLEVVGRVANALDAAWRTPSPDGTGQLQLIHRDLKPSNIRISYCGDVKLLDFGLAHADHADRQAQTEAHMLLGSFLYMAPERYLQEPATSASDAFALGCCLFEGLAGEKLFEGRKPVDLYSLLLDGTKWDDEMDARIATVPSTVPEEARSICRALLTREPDQRMTVTELADTWEDVVEAMGGPNLRRWAGSREWPEQPPVRASLEGSFAASRVMPVELPPTEPDFSDEEDDDDDAPTVRIRAEDYLHLMADLEPSEAPAREPVPRQGLDPIPHPPASSSDPDATQARPPPPRNTTTMPKAKRPGPPERPARRVNWLGAGLLATTTVVVTALVIGMAAVVLVTWLTRERVAPPPPPPLTHAATEPIPQEHGSHVQVEGIRGAYLTRGPRRVEVGAVPPGMWTLWVDFGDGPTRVGTMRVPKGVRIEVACDPSARRCRLPDDNMVPADDGAPEELDSAEAPRDP